MQLALLPCTVGFLPQIPKVCHSPTRISHFVVPGSLFCGPLNLPHLPGVTPQKGRLVGPLILLLGGFPDDPPPWDWSPELLSVAALGPLKGRFEARSAVSFLLS